MAEAVHKITQFSSETEINELSQQPLKEAVFALNHIQDIMKKTASFWEEIASVCEHVTADYFINRVSRIKTDTGNHKKLLTSQAFKERALKYYGKWVAIKEICTTTGKHIYFAQDDMHKYICENPSFEEAKVIIHKQLSSLDECLQLKDAPTKET